MPQFGKYWLSLNINHASFNTAHRWGEVQPRYMVKIGIDDFAQRRAGGLLLVRLIPVGEDVKRGHRFGMLETTRWIGPLIAPVSGKIAQVNEEVLKKPNLANEDPYGKGWMVVINATNPEEDLTKFVKGDQAIRWLKKDLKDVGKETIT